MGTEEFQRTYRGVNLKEGHVLRFLMQECAALGATLRPNQPSILQVDQEPPNYDRISIHGVGEA